MSTLFFLFFTISIFSFLPFSSLSQPPPPPKAIRIDCGAIGKSEYDGNLWLPDAQFVSAGTPKVITTPVSVPILSTLRSFPLLNNRNKKFCYTVNVYHGAKYMVRTTYYYGGINGKDSPPVFDQMVDGTLWSEVNTTADYADGLSSPYEGVFLAQGKTMSVCIGANNYTDSDPFISALEFVILKDSFYNTTDFNKYGLGLVARNSFGYSGPIIRYPDDEFDRSWAPFGKSNPTSNRNVSVSGFWNHPPAKIFQTELTSGQSKPLDLDWPPFSLQNSTYYIALYFAHDSNSSRESSRMFNISINGITYYSNLNVTPAGLVVFATQWPLSGHTRLTLTPSVDSKFGPSINGGEVFGLLTLGGRTVTRDVIALVKFRDKLQNPPVDWNGDPCYPQKYSWTGVTCAEGKGNQTRVVSLNLTGMGLSGSVSASVANLTALTDILLGNNRLSGTIPDLSSLKFIRKLHLEDNQFNGEIPSSLGKIEKLQELYLQNNNLTGQIPKSLLGRSGLDLRTFGNPLSAPPPH
ncbi:leucine-rich repeat receptor-like serine/threonine-protein kinase At2g14510 isoform X2 [Ziziphus jujuba]|uniref:Leucine-rich repeat receptor-like serine/threonine-protein kinase At2g14510 isoform X2 n=1 Tax=Ziziphus jujuba TaxID=326968 RepID=A0A6P4A443_ZIZJJ|nr:leucine-rich repeat receptor-like serine/threonine-protein kinase At2g14510 isoform X2 [Ziziphus jujuba]